MKHRIWFAKNDDPSTAWHVSSDNGTSHNVKAVAILVPSKLSTVELGKTPCGWIECEGQLHILPDGSATIEART